MRCGIHDDWLAIASLKLSEVLEILLSRNREILVNFGEIYSEDL
ncbi:hypothetical protein [Pseudanabaena sp. PCC 6802]|nr:hypothetical protein [Pseudanabaena sp. PCC 6802]